MASKFGRYPRTKDILYLLGMGTLVAASVFSPGVGIILKGVLKDAQKKEWVEREDENKKFNVYALRRNLRRLQEQKIVEFIEHEGEEIIKLTEKGKTKYLRFKLQELSFKGQKWDGKWRLVMYDISKLKKGMQEGFRRTIKQIGLCPLQKSVYLTPYPCTNAITYLREYFDLREEVVLLEVSRLENETFYKDYFDL